MDSCVSSCQLSCSAQYRQVFRIGRPDAVSTASNPEICCGMLQACYGMQPSKTFARPIARQLSRNAFLSKSYQQALLQAERRTLKMRWLQRVWPINDYKYYNIYFMTFKRTCGLKTHQSWALAPKT